MTDVVPTFNGTSATVKTGAAMNSVVLKFTDNTTQQFGGLTSTSGTFSGTGVYAGKTIAGMWVKTGGGDSTSFGTYYGADGSGGTECTLDFFLRRTSPDRVQFPYRHQH
ncbi:MAG: hypothetical protein HC898_11705 [Phycisphaerales bacterium]|nr:hypothetical protein [Phycisphaerales bacterium]